MVFNFAVQLFLPSHYAPSAGLFDPRGKETPKYVSKFAKSEQLLSEHLAPVAEPKRNVQSFRSNSSPVSGSLVAEQIVPLTLINKEVRFFIKTASKNFCDKVFVMSPPSPSLSAPCHGTHSSELLDVHCTRVDVARATRWRTFSFIIF